MGRNDTERVKNKKRSTEIFGAIAPSIGKFNVQSKQKTRVIRDNRWRGVISPPVQVNKTIHVH